MRLNTRTLVLAGTALLTQHLTAGNAVIDWNRIGNEQCAAASTDPLNETRILSIAHIAIHDAVNALDRRYDPYLWDNRAPGTAPEAAIASAAREVLIKLLPSRTAAIEAAYVQALAAIPEGPAKTSAIQTGRLSAITILAAPPGRWSEPARHLPPRNKARRVPAHGPGLLPGLSGGLGQGNTLRFAKQLAVPAGETVRYR